MEFRSTNDIGYVHFQGDIISNVSSGGVQNSSHGIHLTGGSTGGVVQPCGDEANITLNLRPKGAAGVILGNSTNSTAAMLGIQKYRIDFTIADLSSGPAQTESTITVVGLTTNSALFFSPRSVISALYGYGVRCSTAAELKLNQYNVGPSSIGTAATTNSGILLELRF